MNARVNVGMLAALERTGNGDGGTSVWTVPCTARFVYDPADPYAVTVRLLDNRTRRWVSWIFARDLIADALMFGPAGDGDVRLIPEGEAWVWLEIAGSTERARIRFGRGALERALDEAEALVPLGTETTRIDWTALTGGDAA